MSNEARTPPMRRSKRVQVRIPITLSGTAANGKPFSEETFVLTVSKFGAKIKTSHPLPVGGQVKVMAPKGDICNFRVVWVGRERTPRAGEAGIEYVKVSNFLGITFPD